MLVGFMAPDKTGSYMCEIVIGTLVCIHLAQEVNKHVLSNTKYVGRISDEK